LVVCASKVYSGPGSRHFLWNHFTHQGPTGQRVQTGRRRIMGFLSKSVL